ncbi:IS66-like element accessory protein TnpA [Paracoccus rhizosphaerae]|uniref:Transposase n=1 Tax=Paracoccus rhizosphaerae TaxID=1133347 RepID=A0ABV6CS03_9RHOB|nr:transposase [Paracoccus rhizosphaerae]
MSGFISHPHIEVLSAADGVRRRHWSDEDKLRIVEESFVGHRQVAATARRHGMCRSLLTTWRRQYRNGALEGSRPVSFAPVSIVKEAPTAPIDRLGPYPARRDWQVEIALPNGRRLMVPGEVSSEALARLLSVVDGQ